MMRTTVEQPTTPPFEEKLEPEAEDAGGWPDRLFGHSVSLGLTLEQFLWISLVAVAFVMRIWNVGYRAMHHDESMHAYYGWQLFRGGGYQYNPMLHGPFQFHAIALMDFLFGVSNTSARLTAVLCGTGIVAATWFQRPYLGRLGALITGAIFTISPAFLYYSRFTREDIYVAFFTFLMVVGMFGWLHSRRRGYIYLLFTATALAFATKENTFITLFMFGTFLLGVLLWEALGRADGTPVAESIRAIPARTWWIGIGCFVTVIVLLYTTFLTNRHGLIDAFTSSLSYWLAQQGVKRGNQPGYYYALLLPAYEQIPVLFGVLGIAYYVFRRWWFAFLALFCIAAAQVLATISSHLTTPLVGAIALVLAVSTLVAGLSAGRLFATFLTYWALLSFVIYSWAGEKMPWLVIHIAMPLVLLAGLFLGDIFSKQNWRQWGEWRWLAAAGAIFLGLFTIHADWPLNYYRGDIPRDMLIYTQTSPQVKQAVAEIDRLSNHLTDGHGLDILVEQSSQCCTWPFAWYLRDYHKLTYVPVLSSAPTQPVVITSVENDAHDKPLLTNYVGSEYKLRSWFPEDYRGLTLQKALTTITNPTKRQTLWNWLTLRQPPSPLGSTDFDLWIRKDVASSTVSNFAYRAAAAAAAAPANITLGPDPFQSKTVKIPSLLRMGSAGQGAGQLAGPRGIAVAPDGSYYVADQANNRIEKFSPTGTFELKWGSKGSANSQFDSPSGLALDKSGNVWVTDLWNHRVEEFDANGTFLRAFGGYAAAAAGSQPGKFFGPRGIAIGAHGNVYVTDTGNKRVQKFSPTGTFLTMWGQGGASSGQFEEPMGIAVGPGGNVYVADTWNRRIQKFTPAGTFLSQISVPTWPPSQTNIDEPSLAVEPNGVVLATDPLRSRVLAFTRTGGLVTAWGGPGNDAASLSSPTGVAIAPNGQVAVSDTLNNRVLVFPAVK
ncbi:MAG: flippase activity-associated protein Agl23 [Chloroflexota bacterium]